MREEKQSNYGNSETRKRSWYAGTIFVSVFILSMAFLIAGCSKSSVYDPALGDPLKADIAMVVPTNLADSVFVDPVVSVTFKPGIDPDIISATTITLKKGTAAVPGTIAFSGTTASFTTVTDLSPETEYMATVTTPPVAGSGSNATHEYSWRFKTGKKHRISTLAVVSVSPADKAANVPAASPLLITFNQELSTSMKSSVTISLKKGTTVVNGAVLFSGNTATFKPSAALDVSSLYAGKVLIAGYAVEKDDDDKSGNTFNWSFTTAGSAADVTAPVINTVVPANSATAVATSTKATATFSEAMNPTTITAATFTLKQGSTAVTGAVSYSGTTATFTPAAALTAGLVYTATITTGAKDVAGNALAAAYVWSFTTGGGVDVTAPTVLSVVPLNGATTAPTTTKATVTFSEAMNATTINSASFTIKQGSNAIAGTVTYSGTTATFSPTAALAANTLYNATVTTAAKDVAGNAIAANYTWSFTTAAVADVTAPTVVSVVPALNATSVALSSTASATFSEAMDAATITSSTFTLKQGTTAVAGTVTYSGTTAVFTPSAALTGSTVYTATITTGAKDLAGNAIASAYSWSFTTVAPVPTGKSFSADVVPILNICNTCHTHPWTTSSNASTFYTNLVSQGYVNPTSPTTSKIYTKLSGGHPGSMVTTTQVNTILTWFTEGAKNN
jgi:hypothetical protein